MSLRSTTYDAGIVLGALKVPFTTAGVIRDTTTQYIVQDFGVVISVLNVRDYTSVRDKVLEKFYGYRYIYVTPDDNISDKRYDIIWSLMEGGYMKWLRHAYQLQFPTIIETDNLGERIINERLKRWDNKPKFSYLIQDNLEAKKVSFRRLLTVDPSFFDYMPAWEFGGEM